MKADGRQQAPGGVLPAHQRLHPDELAGVEVDDGLVVEDELAPSGRIGHVRLEGMVFHDGVVEAGVIALDAVLAPALGRVHGHVGLAHEVLRIAVGVAHGQPDAGADVDPGAR